MVGKIIKETIKNWLENSLFKNQHPNPVKLNSSVLIYSVIEVGKSRLRNIEVLRNVSNGKSPGNDASTK